MLSAAILGYPLTSALLAACGLLLNAKYRFIHHKSHRDDIKTRVLITESGPTPQKSQTAELGELGTQVGSTHLYPQECQELKGLSPLINGNTLIQRNVCWEIQDENGWALKYSLKRTKLHRDGPCSFAFPPRSPSTRGEAGNAPAAQEGPDDGLGFYTEGVIYIIIALSLPIGHWTLVETLCDTAVFYPTGQSHQSFGLSLGFSSTVNVGNRWNSEDHLLVSWGNKLCSAKSLQPHFSEYLQMLKEAEAVAVSQPSPPHLWNPETCFLWQQTN